MLKRKMVITMKTISKILLGISILFLLMNVVSAEKNTTDIFADTSTTNNAPELIVEDYITEYKSFEPLEVSLRGPNGNLIKNQEISEEFYGDLRYDADCIDNTVYTGIAKHAPLLEAGNYTAYISTNYQGKILYKFIDVNITKAAAKITPYKITATNTNYVTLKAKITDKYGEVNEGKVIFTLNGKTYTAYPNIDGIATKKIKLTNTGTYTYSAKYTCRDYNTVTSKSKVVLKKPTKTVTVKAGKYKKVFGEFVCSFVKGQDGSILKKPSVMITSNGIDMPKHTKLLKAKMYFKNKYTKKIISKTSSKVKWSAISFKLPANYKVYKVKVWYRYK